MGLSHKKQKSDVLVVFQRWLALAENQSGHRLKCLRTDNGGEYMSRAFEQLCDERGIKRQLTAPYTPPQNDMAERMNRTIQERVRSMLSHVGLPEHFWTKAVTTAVHIINRLPCSGIDFQVVEEIWIGKPPSYAHLRVFGCEAFCHVPKDKHNKLDPKSVKCIFLGYGDAGEMGYRLWDP